MSATHEEVIKAWLLYDGRLTGMLIMAVKQVPVRANRIISLLLVDASNASEPTVSFMSRIRLIVVLRSQENTWLMESSGVSVE